MIRIISMAVSRCSHIRNLGSKETYVLCSLQKYLGKKRVWFSEQDLIVVFDCSFVSPVSLIGFFILSHGFTAARLFTSVLKRRTRRATATSPFKSLSTVLAAVQICISFYSRYKRSRAASENSSVGISNPAYDDVSELWELEFKETQKL